MLYTYECKKCGKVEDRFVRLENAEEQYCTCEQKEKLERIVNYSTAFHLKGGGWTGRRRR